MQGILQKQPQIKILPALSVNERLRLRGADIDGVVKTLQGVLPQYVDEDIDVTITLLEKNLKIMADMALMKEALTRLVRNAIDAMPGYGKFSLTIKQANFEIESLLNSDDSIIGACAFISPAGGTDIGVVEKIKEKIFKPFFTIKTYGKDLGLAIAYRIIKSGVRQGKEANIYLPLTKWEMVNMMSIPAW
jgi:signal transduction histidine kinase